MNKNIVIFTKTKWNEPPRIRHQLTRLLVKNGYTVVFFEKCHNNVFKFSSYKSEGIKFVDHFELLHHQLRFTEFAVYLNALIAKHFIKKALKNFDFSYIINFNYDYYFLKDLYPNKHIITLINDDFVAAVNKWVKKQANNQYKKTCEKSDYCLTVSKQLLSQTVKYNKNCSLFLPWAEKTYEYPKNSTTRNTVLYWGYINNRIDWKVLEFLLKNNVPIKIIGPIHKKAKATIERLKQYPNLSLQPSQSIDEIDFSSICCSIIAFNMPKQLTEALTANNRLFQLLSYGIPLVYSALPNLIDAPDDVILKCKNKEEFLEAYQYCCQNYYHSQKNIENFLQQHYSSNRFNQLVQILER